MGFGGGGTGSGASTIIPVGAIMEYAGDGDPSGWLICDGRSLAEAAQPNLFAVIGTTYGDGGGGANFSLPDFVTDNKCAEGATNDADLATEGGLSEVTLTGPESGIAAHTHNYQPNGSISNGIAGNNTANINGNLTSTSQAGPTSAAEAHENRGPFLRVHYIIKV